MEERERNFCEKEMYQLRLNRIKNRNFIKDKDKEEIENLFLGV